MSLDRYAKAIIGAILSGLAALTVALVNGDGVSALEWVTIVTAVVTSLGFIWGVPNTIKPEDLTTATLLEAAATKGFELAPVGSTVKAGKYDVLPSAMTDEYPNG